MHVICPSTKRGRRETKPIGGVGYRHKIVSALVQSSATMMNTGFSDSLVAQVDGLGRELYTLLMHIWMIRALMLLSFLAQCFLVLLASRKNRTNKKWLVMLISAIYFFADWVAPYTIGFISNQQFINRAFGFISHQGCSKGSAFVISGNLLAFWAPILLLHLGSPSNVASLSLDENDMWLKKLIELSSNVITATLVFSKAARNNLLFPASFLVLLAGTLKYAERTLTLFLGRSDRWDSTAALVENTELSQVEENLSTDVQSVLVRPFNYDGHGRIDLSCKELLQLALCFYENFKGFIIVGVSYGPRLRKSTRDFFLKANIFDAFTLVEIELSLIHEDLHTKAAVTRPIIGYTIRLVVFISIIIAFVLFYQNGMDRGLEYRISNIDVYITYVMLLAALLLEIISFVKVLLSVRGVLALGCNLLEGLIAEAMIFRRRWSNSFSRWNMISYCLCNPRDVTNKLKDQLTIRAALKGFKINQTLTSEDFYHFPKEEIFEYLCKISEEAGENVRTAKEICSGRGNLAVREFNCENLIGWSLGGVDYANSLMRWHVATDICIRITNPPSTMNHFYSARLSEYLLYLLLWKPNMIAPDASTWQPIFRHAFLEARQFFHDKSIADPTQAREVLLSKITDIDLALPRGGASESVWFDACRLAKQLISNFEAERRWDLIQTVWMELLVYAAFNSRAITHIRQLGEGGEALTVVWLLMNHLGLGKNFSEAPAPVPVPVPVPNPA